MPLVPAVGQTALNACICSKLTKWLQSGIKYIVIKYTRLTKFCKFHKLMEGFGLFEFQHQLFECSEDYNNIKYLGTFNKSLNAIINDTHNAIGN